jgi:hypothetical protein
VRGLNSRARRNVVHELVGQKNISLLSLQETKLDDYPARLVLEIYVAGFDFLFSASNKYMWGHPPGVEARRLVSN